MALNWDYITSTTREIFIPKLEDDVYDSSALLKIMLKDKRVLLEGGRKVVQPLKYGKSTAAGTYDKYDTFDMTPFDKLTAAEWTWGHYYSTAVISGTEEAENMGKARVINLLQAKFDEASMALKEAIANDIYSGSSSGKGIVGLSTAVDNSATYGGISVSDFSGWASGVDTTAHTEANMKDSTSSSYVLTLLQNAFRSATHLGQKPNLVITTLKIWDIIETVIQRDTNYNKSTTSGRTKLIGELGYNVLEFRGVPIIADEMAPDNYMYVLNTNFMNLKVHPSFNFKFTGWKPAYNQDAKAGIILFHAQLTLSNRRMHYKFTNLAAS